MDQSKIDMFIAMSSNKLNHYQLSVLKDRLANATDSQYQAVLATELKDPITLLIVSLLIGYLGVDRFMLDDVGLGVGKLLTCGGFGIWAIIDIFLIQDRTREYNFNKLMQILALTGPSGVSYDESPKRY